MPIGQRAAHTLLFILATISVAASSLAQPVTGVLGSPSATTTISGKQLPLEESQRNNRASE